MAETLSDIKAFLEIVRQRILHKRIKEDTLREEIFPKEDYFSEVIMHNNLEEGYTIVQFTARRKERDKLDLNPLTCYLPLFSLHRHYQN